MKTDEIGLDLSLGDDILVTITYNNKTYSSLRSFSKRLNSGFSLDTKLTIQEESIKHAMMFIWREIKKDIQSKSITNVISPIEPKKCDCGEKRR